LARSYLEAQGLRFVTRNYRCRRGELDLVMLAANILVFVEVRFRASPRFGTPAETVHLAKQRRLSAAAGDYLQRHPTNLPCRFDVVALSGGGRIEWIQHAFDVA
jgi:putative endonuclease